MGKALVSIACASGFWGDTPLACAQVLREPKLDYIVFDYLSEVTMTLLAKVRKKDPAAGYTADFLTDVIEPHLANILERKIKLISNAGGMNPLALRDRILEFAKSKGLQLKIVCVVGDDLGSDGKFVSRNAYLGASGLVAALGAGADIVITGRVVDSALVLGPLMHEFQWSPTDYDKLAQGSLAGHIVECGAQCCGGNFTDWQWVPHAEDVGFPIVRVSPAGDFIVTKAPKTGGMVTTATVAEQIVYEIGNPTAYRLPDVDCDFSEVRVEQQAENVVRVTGARGRAPGSDYKVSATSIDGFKVHATAFVGGVDAKRKASAIGETILHRARRRIRELGLKDFSETLIETLGGDDECLLRLSAAHSDVNALEILAKEVAPAATSLAPGMTNLLGGRAHPVPRVAFTSQFVKKSDVKVEVVP